MSRDPNFKPEGVFVLPNFKDAFWYANDKGETELMVIGGRKIYEEALPYADTIYLTRVLRNVEGDTYFPSFDIKEWTMLNNLSPLALLKLLTSLENWKENKLLLPIHPKLRKH